MIQVCWRRKCPLQLSRNMFWRSLLGPIVYRETSSSCLWSDSVGSRGYSKSGPVVFASLCKYVFQINKERNLSGERFNKLRRNKIPNKGHIWRVPANITYSHTVVKKEKCFPPCIDQGKKSQEWSSCHFYLESYCKVLAIKTWHAKYVKFRKLEIKKYSYPYLEIDWC